MSADDWAVVNALSTLVGALVVSVASVLALFQLREMARTRSLEALLGIFDEASNTETNNARRYVLTNDLPPPEQITSDI